VLLKTISSDTNTIKKWAILDSGATSHFLTTDAPASNIRSTATPLVARLPNGDKVQSTHTCTLDLPELPIAARHAHIIPGLASHSLLSVVTMCNAGCKVTFTKIGCSIEYRGRTIICGHKCTKTGLWMVPIQQGLPPPAASLASISKIENDVNPQARPTTAMAANVEATSSAPEYARYVHQLLCSPPAATLLKALTISTELSTIPGLTPALVMKHLPRSTATDKGHMRRHRSNTASTRNVQQERVCARAEVNRMMPRQELCNMQDILCFAALADANTGTMYTDLTGAFPVRSFKNMQYVFVAYVYDLNAIIVRPMPARTDAAMVTAFEEVITVLKARGYSPALNVMDNECSKTVEQYIRSNNIAIQLVPPDNHRVNAAERAIATFKEHLIAGLSTVDKLCPLQLWDEFLPQVELTLNLLRFSRRNPRISANEEVYGAFDFNKTPLAPLGTKALVYDGPESRASWAPHATDGYYVGPAPNHYRCLRFYIPNTRRFRFSDTWRLYPTHCQIPIASQHDLSILAATDLLKAFGGMIPTSAADKAKHVSVVQQLTKILTNQPTTRTDVPSQRVDGPAPRVAPPPRVATTSNNTTSPTTVQTIPLVHQRQTRNNNPFQILTDNDDDDNDDDDRTVVASNRSTDSRDSVRCPTMHPISRPTRQRLIHPPVTLPISTKPAPSPTVPQSIVHDIRPTPLSYTVPTPIMLRHELPIVEDDEERNGGVRKQPTTPPRRSS
jgi:hypothetical protein